MQLTIGKKLGLGFGAVLLLMAISASVAYFKIADANQSVHKVVDEAFPTITACNEMLNGLNHSAAALRGYIILGNDPKLAESFKNDRQLAWSRLDDAMKTLVGKYRNATDLDDQKNFGIVQSQLELLRKDQQEVERLAQDKENIPAYELLTTQAIPQAEKVMVAMTAMIAAEDSLELTAERKTLLKNMADFGSSFAYGLAQIRAFVLTADPTYKKAFDDQWKVNDQAYSQLVAHVDLFQGEQAKQWADLKTARTEFAPLPKQMFDMRAGNDWNKANNLMVTKTVQETLDIRNALEALKDAASERAAQDRKNLEAASSAVVWTLIMATIAAIAIGSGVAIVLSRRLASAIQILLARVQAVATGDLTGAALKITSRDEIGQLATGFNEMTRSLGRLLSESSSMTAEVATSSTEIATGVQQQVASLNQTATSLNQITTTAEEFKATMQEFADRARAVQEAADETAKRSSEGRTLTQDSASRIDQVRANSRAAGQSVLSLSEQMQRIGEITATVNEIAEQTKLLALNASIEAARAGEDGRGFAVVATQVRELANQSKESAGRIESLITDARKSMQEVVQKIEEGSRLSQDSTDMVRRVTQAFEEIALAIEQTREAMTQINTGARQQEQGIAELVSSITEIDSGSKESLTAAEQTQKSIISIDQRIRALNSAIARFKT